MENNQSDWQRATAAIHSAEALVIAAGAGMGVDSGLPDFRGTEGFWRAYPPIAKLQLRFEQMASPEWFRKDVALAWGFYGHRLLLYRQTVPHEGFTRLLHYAKSLPYGYFIYTSNVDGQFQKAGFDAQRIEECHGSIHHLQCSKPCSDDIWDAHDFVPHIDMQTLRASLHNLPHCPHCGAVARPNILMFGDSGWLYERTNEQNERYNDWIAQLQGKKVVIIEMGAGVHIPSVRMHAEHIANKTGGLLIRINPREPQVPAPHIGLACGAAEGLQRLGL